MTAERLGLDGTEQTDRLTDAIVVANCHVKYRNSADAASAYSKVHISGIALLKSSALVLHSCAFDLGVALTCAS